MPNVTVVIPVYKDWTTLRECIESLKKYLPDRHKVILVNDKGPDWEKMEHEILANIDQCSNFFYFRNEENLGFVKTCNRAVFELDKTDNDILLLNSDTEVTSGFIDELLAVLYAAEKHGVVCPRSNNATLLTIPVRNDLDDDLTAEQSYISYCKLKRVLPRYQVLPTGVGFAMLIKRKLIVDYGLFDEVYSPGYNEENDFCMRINQYGFNVVMANHAFVYHHESKSFGGRKKALDEEHFKILTSRYPYYLSTVRAYFDYQISPIDFFGDLIADVYAKRKVLISLYEMPAAHNGTAQHGLSLLDNFWALFNDKYDISILINRAADDFFGVSDRYANVYFPDTLKGTFHIAYVPSQIIHVEHMHILNRTCLKYAFCMQDIISIRSRYLLTDDWEREIIFRKSIEYCDGIIPFSQFSLDDTRAYYYDCFERREIYTKVVYLAGVVATEDKSGTEKTELPYKHYIAVLGNGYKHKNLELVIPELLKSKYNYIIVGSKENRALGKNVYGYKSGSLSDGMLEIIQSRCDALLFPSVYEGFGLPILNAISHRKKIVINDNPLNREQRAALPNYAKYISTFNHVNEIEECFDGLFSEPSISEDASVLCTRTWKDVAYEVEQGLNDIVNMPVDIS